MNSMIHRRRSLLMRTVACAVIASGPVTSAGFIGAGPRTGTVYHVEITLAKMADLQVLARGGFDIDSRAGNRVRLYVTPAEAVTLQHIGYAVSIVPESVALRSEKDGAAYHSYADLAAFLVACTSDYPAACQLVSLGQSVGQRDLWALKITTAPESEDNKPEVKIIGSIHGNEPVGMEMCVRLADDLLRGWSTNDVRMTNLVDSTEIWIVPLMNPDGWSTNPPSRYNANGYDLNRSFPEGSYQNIGNSLYGPAVATNGLEPEVQHVMQWSTNHNFLLSVSLHVGSLVVNYPYDSNEAFEPTNSPTPDDPLIRDLALTYSIHSTSLWNSAGFSNGIVNGAEWYPVDGGMQDWNYRYVACNEFTIELGVNKMPAAGELDSIWTENRESMLSLIESVHRGVRGSVGDAVSGGPVRAAVEVVGLHHLAFSSEAGDYHRLLLPGCYDLLYSAPGYQSLLRTNVTVVDGPATVLDVLLPPTNRFFSAAINFQPASSVLPAGYRSDTGDLFAAHAGGLTYGWNSASGHVAVARDAGESQDLRFDTVCALSTSACWEIQVDPGLYHVVAVAGDPRSASNNFYRLAAEGVPLVNGRPTASNRWVRGEATVAVMDGRLTLAGLDGATNNRLCYLELDRSLTPLERWRVQGFENPDNTGDAANSADPDRDGAPNLLEYACGTTPTNDTSAPFLGAALTGPDTTNRFAVQFNRATNATDVTYQVQGKDDLLIPDSWSNMATYSALTGWTGPAAEQDLISERSTGATVQVTVGDADGFTDTTQRYLRIAVEQP